MTPQSSQTCRCANCGKEQPVHRSSGSRRRVCISCGEPLEGAPREKREGSREARAARRETVVADLLNARVGNYTLLSVLGYGRMGIVFLARDEVLRRQAAVKILSWAFKGDALNPMEWFLSEARTVAGLNHPGIIQVYAAGEHRNYSYIAMEYVDGPSTAGMLDQSGSFTPVRATELLVQTAQALQAAHQANVIHRDVKPANLLVGSDGKVKLGDFGLALTVDPNVPASRQRAGTPEFMAPEVWSDLPVSPAADIYSLGATYFRLLTGRGAYAGRDPDDMRKKHLEQPVPDPRQHKSDIPRGCADIVMRCMAKAPAERPSAQEVAWLGTSLLMELESPLKVEASAAASPLQRAGFTPASDLLHDTQQAVELGSPLAKLGFQWQPFARLQPGHTLYSGEPFASLQKQVSPALSEAGAVIYISGNPGSGRTTFCLQQLTALGSSRPVMYVDLSTGSQRPLRRVCVSAGVPLAGAPEGELQDLLTKLAAARSRHGQPPIVAIDGLSQLEEAMPELRLLARSAAATKSYSLLVVGAGGVPGKTFTAAPDLPIIQQFAVPSLDFVQAREYFNAWISATSAPDAPPLIVTPDAVVMLAFWSNGVLLQMNRLAIRMLHAAADDDQRIITSWHAWVAAKTRDSEVAADTFARFRKPPDDWPGPDVLKIINEGRRKAGLSLRPSQTNSLEPSCKSEG